MRQSPLRHPLAILRLAIGLTQKEMANLVKRAPRTIQAVELGKLPLSQDLAMLIAQATGVDAGWLLEKDTTVPPRKGTTAMGMGSGTGEYTRADYEFHRAFIESPTASRKEIEAIAQSARKSGATGKELVTLSLPVMKTLMLAKKKEGMQVADQALLNNFKRVLDQTTTTESGDLIRWKVRQFLRTLITDFHLKMDGPAAPTSPPMHMVVADIHGDEPSATPTGKTSTKPAKRQKSS